MKPKRHKKKDARTWISFETATVGEETQSNCVYFAIFEIACHPRERADAPLVTVVAALEGKALCDGGAVEIETISSL